MAELKTKKSNASVKGFINSISDLEKRKDAFEVLRIMKEVTKEEPKMWGDSIIGFGEYNYKYASGNRGNWPVAAFSPRKQNMTIYFGNLQYMSDLLKKLGKYKTGKVCLYFNRLEDIDTKVLKSLIKQSLKEVGDVVIERKSKKKT